MSSIFFMMRSNLRTRRGFICHHHLLINLTFEPPPTSAKTKKISQNSNYSKSAGSSFGLATTRILNMYSRWDWVPMAIELDPNTRHIEFTSRRTRMSAVLFAAPPILHFCSTQYTGGNGQRNYICNHQQRLARPTRMTFSGPTNRFISSQPQNTGALFQRTNSSLHISQWAHKIAQ